jgi:hypothetical protein
VVTRFGPGVLPPLCPGVSRRRAGARRA